VTSLRVARVVAKRSSVSGPVATAVALPSVVPPVAEMVVAKVPATGTDDGLVKASLMSEAFHFQDTALSVIAGLAACVLGAGMAPAQEIEWRNAGTLSCTTEPAADDLSCSFKGLGGLEGDFAGKVAGGNIGEAIGKRVLVWTVLTSKPDLKLQDLAGPYAPIAGGDRMQLLLGGAARVVQLQPMTASPQDATGPAVTLIDLSIKPTRA
jgi:hypothetical protein